MNTWRGPLVLLYKEGSMGMGRPKVALTLTDDEGRRLERTSSNGGWRRGGKYHT